MIQAPGPQRKNMKWPFSCNLFLLCWEGLARTSGCTERDSKKFEKSLHFAALNTVAWGITIKLFTAVIYGFS
jgi:hypothetical protein